jgi:hypothetical protein
VRALLILTFLVTGAIGVGVAVEAATSKPGSWQITAEPPLVRIPPAGPCPPTALGFHDVENARDNLRREMLPPDPLFGLICRYGTTPGGRLYTLERSAPVNGRTARALETAIATISTSKPHGIAMCPTETARVTVLAFGYAHRNYVDLWYVDTGCATLDNGYLKATVIENPPFFDRFAPLVDQIAPRTR